MRQARVPHIGLSCSIRGTAGGEMRRVVAACSNHRWLERGRERMREGEREGREGREERGEERGDGGNRETREREKYCEGVVEYTKGGDGLVNLRVM